MFSEVLLKQKRFIFVDGLRGLAAILVLLFHLYTGTLYPTLSLITPAPLDFLMAHGYLGVQIFFVISGFVIAYSLRNATATLAFIKNFTIRRFIRLNPAYYVTIALTVADRYLPNLLWNSNNSVPNIVQIITNIFYLQNITGYGDIVPVFWTLCMEIQFYLVFILVLVIAEKLSAWLKTNIDIENYENFKLKSLVYKAATSTNYLIVILMTPLFIASLALLLNHISFQNAWFLEYWYMFNIGVLVYWTLEGRIKMQLFYIYFIGMLISAIFVWEIQILVVTITAGSIYLAGCYGGLYKWLGGKFFQYFGSISYSLYLIHYTVGYRFLNLSNHLKIESKLAAVVLFIAAILVSILAAHLLYIFIEKPSMEIGKKLKKT